MKKRILSLAVGLSAAVSFISCSGYNANSGPPSRLHYRVLAAQGISATSTFAGLFFVNGQNDTIARVSPLSAGSNPGMMALSPTHNIAAALDASTNTVVAIDTNLETTIGSVRLPGPTSSFVVPSASAIGYAAVPTATVNGFAFLGAVEVMNFSTSTFTTIAVNNAQTVVANNAGAQLLVFSADSDSVTVLSPAVAVPPVDVSCVDPTNPPPNAVCTIVPGFDRPVDAIISGSTAYVLNCGPQCGGVQASVAIFDLSTLTITQTIPVDAATTAFLSGSNLYVAGTPGANNDCAGQTTAATVCGRLDIVDVGSGTVTGSVVITDGYHTHMDMTTNGQLFIGARDCTNIGNVGNPNGEVRGCLSIYKTADGSVIIPPDNGDVKGLQGFISRNVEYVAEGGALRVYDTTKDVLLINKYVPQGSINIVGYIGDVKAIDFF